MLVFIRKDLMPLYQTYRTALKKSNNDIDKTKEILSNTLPDNVSYETLEFIHEVKTTRPIPWIKEFNDITDIKKEIQKKMLNELAELFLIKNKRIEIITDAFNKAMFSLTAEEQKKVLSTIDATKEFIDTFDKIEDYKQQIKTTEEELQKVKKISATEKTASEEKIKELKKELTKAEKTVNSSFNDFFIQNGHVQIGNYTGNLNSFSPVKAVAGGIYGTAIKTCSKCNKLEAEQISGAWPSTSRNCILCRKQYCSSCWPNWQTSTICPDCFNKNSPFQPKVTNLL